MPAQFCQVAVEVVMAGEGTRVGRGGRPSRTIGPEWWLRARGSGGRPR